MTFSANAFSGPGSSNSGEDWAANTNLQVVPVLPTGDPNIDHGLLGSPALASGMILRAYGNISPTGWLAEDGDASFKMTFSTPISSISMVFAGVAPMITSVAVRPGTFFDYVAVDNIMFQQVAVVVPEPGTWALMALGLAGVAAAARRRVR